MKWQRLHRLYHTTKQGNHRHRRRMEELGRSYFRKPLRISTTRLWPPTNLGSLMELAHWAQTSRGPELGFRLQPWYTRPIPMITKAFP